MPLPSLFLAVSWFAPSSFPQSGAHGIQSRRADVAASCAEGTLKLWRVADGALLQAAFRHPRHRNDRVRSRRAMAGQRRLRPHGAAVPRVRDGTLGARCAPAGRVVRSSSVRTASAWSAAARQKTVRVWRVGRRRGCENARRTHAERLERRRSAPSGRLIGGSGSFDQFDSDLAGGRRRARARAAGTGTKQAVIGRSPSSPDGRWLASCGRRRRRSASGACATARRLRVLTGGGTDHVYGVAFSPDSRWLASGGRGQGAVGDVGTQVFRGGKGQTVRLWRVATAHCSRCSPEHADDVMSVAVQSGRAVGRRPAASITVKFGGEVNCGDRLGAPPEREGQAEACPHSYGSSAPRVRQQQERAHAEGGSRGWPGS